MSATVASPPTSIAGPPGQGGFVERLLSFSFTLGSGAFAGTASNTVSVSGLRATATVHRAGLPARGTATMRIYGLSQSLMQQLSSLGVPNWYARKNTVTILAGDAVSGMSSVFSGQITAAWADYSGAPEVGFNVNADSGYIERLAAIPATSVQGPADVAGLISGIAEQIGYAFENNGVSGLYLSNPYYFGTGIEQARAIAEHAGIGLSVEDTPTNALAIFPLSKGRSSQMIPLVSANTGMVGYPEFAGGIQISLRSVFNPAFRWMGSVQVKSLANPQANGLWQVWSLTHSLATLLPDGDWFSDISGVLLANLPAGLAPEGA